MQTEVDRRAEASQGRRQAVKAVLKAFRAVIWTS